MDALETVLDLQKVISLLHVIRVQRHVLHLVKKIVAAHVKHLVLETVLDAPAHVIISVSMDVLVIVQGDVNPTAHLYHHHLHATHVLVAVKLHLPVRSVHVMVVIHNARHHAAYLVVLDAELLVQTVHRATESIHHVNMHAAVNVQQRAWAHVTRHVLVNAMYRVKVRRLQNLHLSVLVRVALVVIQHVIQYVLQRVLELQCRQQSVALVVIPHVTRYAQQHVKIIVRWHAHPIHVLRTVRRIVLDALTQHLQMQ